MNRRSFSSLPGRARERGMVLIVTLLVLVVTILAAVALTRSVDVATLVSGNLAFRQAAVQAADAGVENALNWLQTQATADITSLNGNQGSGGNTYYYATWSGGIATAILAFNPATFVWTGNSNPLTADPDTGNQVFWVVHRMCQNVGDPSLTTTNCYSAQTVTTGGSSNRVKEPGDLPCFDPNNPGKNLCGVAANPYYRISVRVLGPRGTVSYAQAVVY